MDDPAAPSPIGPPPAAPGRRQAWRRPTQVGLRDLLWLLVVVALGLGWWNAVRRPPSPPATVETSLPTSFPHGGTIYGRYEGGELGGEKFDAIEVRDDVLITRSGPTYSYLRWGGRVTIVAHGPP